jgi:uncharacterized protein YdhG (YjbR/CyaY superfamily)
MSAEADGRAAVDAYIDGFDEDRRAVLTEVRAAIHRGVHAAIGTDGEEKVRYGIAAVMLGGREAIHFAGWKRHLGIYPVPELPAALDDEVAPFRAEKDSARFPWSQPMPYRLIERIAEAIALERGGR